MPKKEKKSIFEGEFMSTFITTFVLSLIFAPIFFIWDDYAQAEYRRKEYSSSYSQSYIKHNPIMLPAVGNSASYMSCNSVADKRKTLVANINEGGEWVKGQKHSLKARMDGDTLWVFAPYLREYGNRHLLAMELNSQFMMCEIYEVRGARVDAGGVEYWTVWTHEDYSRLLDERKRIVGHD